MVDFFYYIGILCFSSLVLYLTILFFAPQGWWLRLGTTVILRPNLKNALKKLLNELPGNITKDTLSEVLALVFNRLTRVAIIGCLLAFLPIWLLYKQNTKIDRQNDLLSKQDTLLEIQNDRIDQQTKLLEASRRSGLGLLMSSLLDQLGDEILVHQEKFNVDRFSMNSTKWVEKVQISSHLIGRVAALSQAFRPYRYLDADTLITSPLSPERGQLLLTLLKSNLSDSSYQQIFRNSSFVQADLAGFGMNPEFDQLEFKNAFSKNGPDILKIKKIKQVYPKIFLKGINLTGANLVGANFNNINLEKAKLDDVRFENGSVTFSRLHGASIANADCRKVKFSYANLNKAAFYKSKFNNANFSNVILDYGIFIDSDCTDAIFKDAKLFNTVFKNVDLSRANFASANLTGAVMTGSNLNNAVFTNAILERVDWEGVKNVTFEQIQFATSLYQSKGLSDSIMAKIKEIKPQLLKGDQ